MEPDIIRIKPKENLQEIFISNKVKPEVLKEIGTLLKASPGIIQIAIVIVDEKHIPVREKMFLPYRVNWNEGLEKKINKLSGLTEN
jgi:hypothetical protein